MRFIASGSSVVGFAGGGLQVFHVPARQRLVGVLQAELGQQPFAHAAQRTGHRPGWRIGELDGLLEGLRSTASNDELLEQNR